MTFLWPHNLWWMLALPALALVYVWLLRRRAKAARGRVGWGLMRETAGHAGWRQLPLWLVLAALFLLVLAMARPMATVSLPWARSTVMLAVDISRSMRVTDVKPTRMVAAQEAAKAFLNEVPQTVDVALVTFAGTAQVAQPATTDREALTRAIDAIQMQLGTAIGNGIVVCLAELFPDHGSDLAEMTFGPGRPPSGQSQRPGQAGPAKGPPKAITPVPPGSYKSAAIILLTDGRRTVGVDTLVAAQMAADRGVKIYVVGLGTPDGHLAEGDGMAIYLQLDEPTLRQVAQIIGGEYHQAATAEALRSQSTEPSAVECA
jgi:Ca-activated chloride channel homolog